MSTKHCEAVKSLYKRRVEQGLCGKCGKPLDRNGSVCISCNEKHKKYTNESRKWFKEHGICPTCGKNELFGDENNCPECRAKKAEWMQKAREKNGDKISTQHNISQNKRYHELIDAGICPNCKKRQASNGMRMCDVCHAKLLEQRRVRNGYYVRPKKSERHTLGLCAFCKNPIKPGYKVCETHYQKCLEIVHSENSIKARERLKREGAFTIWGLKGHGKV